MPFEPRRGAVPRGRARRRLVGAARRARSTWSARSAARRRSLGRWTSPASGPAASGPGTSTASTSRPAAARPPGRVLRRAGRRAARAGPSTGSRSACHLIEGLVQHGAPHRVHRPPARGAGRARHAGGRPRARDQQPGLGRDPGGRRARRRPATRCSSSLAPAGRDGDHRRAVHRARRAAPRGRAAAGRRWTRWRWPTARTSCPTGSSDHGVERDWVIAPPLAAAGVDVAWCERAADAARRRRARARPGVGREHAVDAPRCSPR